MRKCRAVVCVASIVMVSSLLATPRGYGFDQKGTERHGRGVMADLSEEQREAIHTRIAQLKDEGASREEMRAAVHEMLKGYGVEVPEHRGEGPGRMGFFRNLTEEQREAIREKMDQMRSEGATGEEIRAAVGEMLKGYGVEVPEHRGEGPGRMGFFRNLTEEQREAIREKMDQMHSEGATREEIRAAVHEMLKGYGVEVPEHERSGSETTLSSEGTITSSTSLQQSYAHPNPFYEQTNISYSLGAREDVQIQIYNATGQLVHSFEMGVQDPGSYSVQWDGTYENGAKVPVGVYLYRIGIGGEPVTGRLVLLR